MQVRSAVIPAAGLGTRFLPATKAVPKELFPIGDRPAIAYLALNVGPAAGTFKSELRWAVASKPTPTSATGLQ